MRKRVKKIKISKKSYDIVTLDFETFYDTGYSLTSMSTTDYIQDKRFHAHGVSIKLGDRPARWFTDVGMHMAIRAIDWSKAALLCHNTLFDGFILHEHFDVHPAFYMDTLCMSRAALGHHMRLDLDTVGRALGIGGKIAGELIKTKGLARLTNSQAGALGPYANNDVERCHDIYTKLEPFIPVDELELIDLTLRMFCEPILRVDRKRVQAELDKQVATKAWSVGKTGVDPKLLRSRTQFAGLLQAAGARVPMKISKSTGQPTMALAATDEGFKELLRSDNVRVKELCEAKLAVSSSIGETRPKRFLTAVLKNRKLPVCLNYSGAHTHRWSGGNKMNMQNLERGGELRKSILAPVGNVLVVADSAQIEARIVAWLAGETQLVEAFRARRDIYSEFATLVYGRPIDRKRKLPNGSFPDFDEGFVGKTCFAADTEVLTQRGWIPILYVTTSDLVWDGMEWVTHSGVRDQGPQTVETAYGITATPDHEIWMGDSWRTWHEVHTNDSLLNQALSSATLPSSNGNHITKDGIHTSDVHAEKKTSLTDTTSCQEEVRDVIPVQRKPQVADAGGSTKQFCPTTNIAPDCLTEYQPQYNDAKIQEPLLINTMGYMEFESTQPGFRITERFSPTSSGWKGGITELSNLTEYELTKDINPGTFVLLREVSISEINEKSKISNNVLEISKQKTHVYDLVNCGSRHRFVVRSNQGPLIASNCILGLGYGMGADRLHDTLMLGINGPEVDIPRKECQGIIDLYRSKYPCIPALWKHMGYILDCMAAGASGTFKCITYGRGFIQLPGGLFLHYPGLHKGADGNYNYQGRNGPTKIYGGLLTENVVQALARRIIAVQMLEVSRRYRVVLTTHDELVFVTPRRDGQSAFDWALKIMSRPPDWAKDLPLFAEGGFAVEYSK